MYKYFDLLRKHSTSQEDFETVLRHSMEVLAKGIEIVKNKKLYGEVDFELIISGSLLHDIGTFGLLKNALRKDYIKHGIIGGEILRGEGLDREALIAERHTGSGLSKGEIIANGFPLPHRDFLPISLEEKIICYADKFSSKNPGKKDTIKTIRKEFEAYGENSLKRFLELERMFE